MELKTALENIQRVLEKYPEEEIETIRKNKDAAIDSLISIIKYPTENPGSREEKEVVVAMFLLSEFEEKSAFEYLLKYLSFSDNDVYYWLGDILTESFHIILANTMRRSDIDELKKTIEDPAIAEIERIMGVNTLVALCGGTLRLRRALDRKVWEQHGFYNQYRGNVRRFMFGENVFGDRKGIRRRNYRSYHDG